MATLRRFAPPRRPPARLTNSSSSQPLPSHPATSSHTAHKLPACKRNYDSTSLLRASPSSSIFCISPAPPRSKTPRLSMDCICSCSTGAYSKGPVRTLFWILLLWKRTRTRRLSTILVHLGCAVRAVSSKLYSIQTQATNRLIHPTRADLQTGQRLPLSTTSFRTWHRPWRERE